MKILLVGRGGREHAIGWSLVRSPRMHHLISVPGNPGLARLGETVTGLDPMEIASVTEFARMRGVDLVIVGPEDPLAAGIVDALSEAGIPAFGPGRAAARLESSKWYAKQIMARADVATAPAQVFGDRASAIEALRGLAAPYVVKADGLAAGKGVLVTDELEAATAWIDRCLSGGFGEAGRLVLVEEHLEGPEVSVLALCDGKDAVLLPAARDYKRLRDGDRGPNTGGMGSYAPVHLDRELQAQILDEIIRPVLAVLAAQGAPYVGFLYAGLVMTAAGPKVLEFNVRLGDPEAQVILPLVESDLLDLIEACIEGSVTGMVPEWSAGASVNVVLASHGYPEQPRTGDRITGIQEAETVSGALVFHAGTRRRGAGFETGGGRALNVVGVGEDLSTARTIAYRAASHISWPGMQFRTDVAGEVP